MSATRRAVDSYTTSPTSVQNRGVTDDADSQSSEASTAVYKPFPSFASWELGGFDTADFDRYSAMLATAKKSAPPEALEAALTTARRYAAVDTNAIEGIYEVDRGFTRTIATQAAAWEAVMDARGSHVRPAFDDALNGYQYVLDAATQTVEISELWVKELHAIICASQETYTVYTDHGPQERPLPKGTYKTMPNSPTLLDGRVHAYAPVMDTIPEMRRLIDELRSESFLSAHPVLQASYAHYAYVSIHPFADGNGRVARALSSVFLYRSPGVPLVVFADQRNEYYDALESADKGDHFPFVRFMMVRTIDTVGIIRSMIQRNSPPIETALAGIAELFNSGSDIEELHAAAVRLRNLVLAEARTQVGALALPAQLKISANGGPLRLNTVAPPSGYRGVGNEAFCSLVARSSFPYEIQERLHLEVFIKDTEESESELLLTSRAGDGLEVWLRELVPVEAEALKLKVSAWVEGKLAELLNRVAKKAGS